MHYRIFYLFTKFGEALASTNPIEMGMRAICEQLLPRLQTEDDYLGILDSNNNTLQIIYEPDIHGYWVELPIESAKASYGRFMDLTQLKDLLNNLPKAFDHELFPELKYRPW